MPSTLIPVSEYLATMYHPDCDYVDGEVVERNLGEREHAALQGILQAIFHNNRRAWEVVTFPELRVQVAATRFRIPDVCVLRTSDPRESIVRQPPLLCIEILSPEDTLKRTRERAEDYFRMGVEHVWIFDSASREVWVCTSSAMRAIRTGDLTVQSTLIRVSLGEVWAEYDELV